MAQFVIRSMSTTNQPECKPYHIYLKPVGQRSGAYWAGQHYAERFDSIEAAQVEIDRALPRRASYEPLYDIVPVNDALVPTFWVARKLRGNNARVIDGSVVMEGL